MTHQALAVTVFILGLLVTALLIVVLALARQVGVLFERVAPMGALITDSGPRIGDSVPKMDLTTLDGRLIAVGVAGDRSQLFFFVSPDCPVCKRLLPILKSARTAEAGWLDVVLASDGERTVHERFVRERGLGDFPYILSRDLGLMFRISRLPFAVLIDGSRVVRAKGLVNNREQLESLFIAKEIGSPSIQHYLDRAAVK
ncbi:redoxin domain-containing protein [Mesorhizobium sp. M7A.F.Ca.CA.001.09.2.1]|uniref:Redoxin domain-containing protein n=1 Tax=Mesorhizobium ciceri TaxID=39645 RepID=A0AB38TEG6_9HYPH|nr:MULTISPECIES: redoxin domain-containing protein [Mesorhizobium]RUY34872.1 redoxin domain-containing protein [Mesorhizobium sp. M7A.F.Ca.CA.001.13.2.1]MDF3218610.1 redoxin domain-containing protein [Mesorhizobium ciceri]RUY62791.1 redoxin domain-containing protein [Mesorhizobium sp. M7A.F.Ca.CA.001.13.1.1]RUY63083.1 redoxin domain-containing protein [Mesorhizobium sp. M7A.F.Ca.CA.001.05.1.1]RUY74913.1 redoxin domain-containing protein [Mesorhizobium sp. M7A.F.Ca.CA.001.09.2.1]